MQSLHIRQAQQQANHSRTALTGRKVDNLHTYHMMISQTRPDAIFCADALSQKIISIYRGCSTLIAYKTLLTFRSALKGHATWVSHNVSTYPV